MAEFILSDLQAAEENIVYLTESSRALPHLDAVYGLMARYYMWLEDYPNAKTYARKAIDESKLKNLCPIFAHLKSERIRAMPRW